jgi:hypothetical protein
MMKNLLVLGIGLLSLGCALETGAPEEVESVDSIQQGVVTRAKTVSFLPARMCDSIKSDIDAWNWSCFANFSQTAECTEGWAFGAPKAAPRRKYVGSGTSIYFAPGGGQSWYVVDDEIRVANVSSIACYSVGKDNEYPLIRFREGLKPGRSALAIETIFEHIRPITVRATVDIAFVAGDPVYDKTVEVALQTQSSAGAWVDRAVRGSEYAYFDADEVAWVGEPSQILTVSAKVPANDVVRLLVRTGSGAVSGSDVRFSLRDAELRGEECVPDVSGGCL